MIFNQIAAGGGAIKSIQSVTAKLPAYTELPLTLSLTTTVNPQNCIYEVSGTATEVNLGTVFGWMISEVSSTNVTVGKIASSYSESDSVISITVIEFKDGIIKQNYFQTVNPRPGQSTTLSSPITNTTKALVAGAPLARIYWDSDPAAYRPTFNFSNNSTILCIGNTGSGGNIGNSANVQIIEFY